MERQLAVRIISTVWILLLISGCAVDQGVNNVSSRASAPKAWIGIQVAHIVNGTNASHKIVSVMKNSPGFRAGLKAGDEIWFVGNENAGYLSPQEVAKKLTEAGPQVIVKVKRPGIKGLVTCIVKRNNTASVRQTAMQSARAASTGRAIPVQSVRNARRRGLTSNQGMAQGKMANARVTDPFEIPGLPARETKTDGINELKRVYLDPSSGRMVFVGAYNKAYDTGAIDYSALLNDALESPSPSFSLEPTPQSKNAVFAFAAQLDRQMKKNLGSVEAGKAWLTRIFDLLLSDSTLGNDRQRFFKKGADILKCKPEDMPEITQALLGRAHQDSPAFLKFSSAFYKSQGNPQMDAYLKSDGDSNATVGALEWMGLGPLRQELLEKIRSHALTQEQGEFLLEVALWRFNYRKMNVPEYRWKKGLANAEASFSESVFRKVIDNLNAALFTERVMEPWLNGMVFSEQFLHRMLDLPPIETTPSCREGLSSDSELARTFLEADWYLKTLTQEPELAQKVTGHLTGGQFLFQRESKAGQYNTNGVECRFWLKPESAPLSYDTGRRIISFQTPDISINAELLAFHGTSSNMRAMVQDGLNSYGRMLTRNYEAYAKVLPPLHRLREAAKVLALANWARQQGIRLAPPEPPAPPMALPARFSRGFWSAQFVSRNDRTFIEYSAEGGVDFGQDVGNNWIQAGEDNTLGQTAMSQLAGSAALGQQAVDAALKGNLDAARKLAGDSALAMTGEYDFSANPALPKIPEASPPAPVFQAELQTEAIKQTQKAVNVLAHSTDEQQRAGATQQLQQIKRMITTPSPVPQQIHTWVKLLRNGDFGTLSAPISQPAPLARVTTPVRAIQKASATEEKTQILDEITDLRMDLCRIQLQLRRFNATIQADQAQRGEWENTVDKAYNSALDRAKSKVADFSIDFPEGLLEDHLKSIADPVEKEKLERALKMVQHLKEAYKLKDFSQWAANEHYRKKEIMDGFKLIANIIGVDDKIKTYLIKRWGLKKVLAYKDAASDLIASAYDVTAEVLSWQRLTQLNRNSDAFLVAIKTLARHQHEVMAQIHERELRLGLKPGATKGLCP